jgi:hypothetical protein
MRYKIYSQAVLAAAILALFGLLALACCMQADALLTGAQLVNQQYNAHLFVCTQVVGGRGASGGPPPSRPGPNRVSNYGPAAAAITGSNWSGR